MLIPNDQLIKSIYELLFSVKFLSTKRVNIPIVFQAMIILGTGNHIVIKRKKKSYEEDEGKSQIFVRLLIFTTMIVELVLLSLI